MTDSLIPATGTNTVRTGHLQQVARPIPFHRLLRAETRKLFDTRSGRAMTAILTALTLAAIIGRGVVAGPHLETLIRTSGLGIGILLPVLGVLTVTGEWHHRTALTTFTLEPRRGRVLAAKCLPPLITTAAACLLAVLVAAPVTALVAHVRDVPATWEVHPLALLGWTGANILAVAAGLALGALLLNAPAAIVIYLSAPILGTLAGGLGTAGQVLTEWLDLNRTTVPLAAGDMTGGEAVRLATSILLWIAVPMAAGAMRVIRKEVN